MVLVQSSNERSHALVRRRIDHDLAALRAAQRLFCASAAVGLRRFFGTATERSAAAVLRAPASFYWAVLLQLHGLICRAVRGAERRFGMLSYNKDHNNCLRL